MAISREETETKWQELRDGYFAGREVIIAANRAPVTFNRSPEGELMVSRGAGGLVTALIGLTHQVPATWIGCARSAEDVQWGSGDIAYNEDHHLHVRFINPEPDVYERYYNVISNPLLWFLQHSMWDTPRAPMITRATWDAWENGYKVVNRMFADALAEHVRSLDTQPVILLQDYHLYLVPRLVRAQFARKHRPLLTHFVHIPWPGPEYWRILPSAMRHSIVDGLCAADLLGFQTDEDGLNFIRSVESFLPGASVNYLRRRIWYRNHSVSVSDFPISIDIDGLRQQSASDEVGDYRREILQEAGENALIVRIDRAEPSKNILRGFLAFEELLVSYPQHRGRVKFMAFLMSSRLDVPEYQSYMDELMAAAGRVNARFGEAHWEPVRVMVGENLPRAMAAMQVYDVLLVNSIADGMNLVAKEGPTINQRNGVLILSDTTGARQQLAPGALVISPCDIYATSEAMHNALEMPEAERIEKADRLRWLIEREDITCWLLNQFQAVKDLGL